MPDSRLQLQLVRVLRLMRLLESARASEFTWVQLAERFNVSTRTVRRDVQALRDSGAEIVDDFDLGANRTLTRLYWRD